MDARAFSIAMGVAVVAVLFPYFTRLANAGLYGDKVANVTTGDLKDQDYWATKFDLMMLDIALKQHQPEGRIGVNLSITDRRLDDLIKKYPKDEDLKQWKKKVNDIQSKIDPNANRNEDWKPGCPWDEANFSQAWMNYYYGKMLIADNDIPNAKSIWSNVTQNFNILTQPDRLKDYPDDLKKWVEDHKEEVKEISKQLHER